MARKSAAQLKPIPKKDAEDLRPIEAVFEEAKEMFILTVDTQIKTAARVDNLLNIRDYCDHFWKNDGMHESLDYYKKMQQLSIDTYKKVKEAAESFELVDFRAVEIKDYFAGIIPEVDTIENMQRLCEAGLIFMSVQPYGGKLIQLHQLMQDEFAKRNIMDD